LGLFVTDGKLNKETIVHIIKSTKYQLLAIYDLSLFMVNPNNWIGNVWGFGKLAIGYVFYVLPALILGYF